MLTYIDNRLRAWALWSHQSRGGGAYVSQYTYEERIGGIPASIANSAVLVNEECAEMEMAVAALDRYLQNVVTAHYRDYPDRTAWELAMLCHCSKATYFRRLHQSHNVLLGWLNDHAAGLIVKPVDNRETDPVKSRYAQSEYA